MKLIGVLLAAGRSERMGRPKQLLPWPPKGENSKPLVAAAFDAIAGACDEMLVVLGHKTDEVVAALGDRTFRPVNAGNGQSEMISSICTGLFVSSRLDSSAHVLLYPADHPEVRRDTLDAIIRTADVKPNCAVMPRFRGQGGHPVLIPPSVVKSILEYRGCGGLRQFWIDHANCCVRIAVDDPGVVFDIDTQSDYDFRVE